jgi:hypothetical protein
MAAGPHRGSGAVPQFCGGVPYISVTPYFCDAASLTTIADRGLVTRQGDQFRPAMIKLRARDRAQLVVIAYKSGLVRPGWRA